MPQSSMGRKAQQWVSLEGSRVASSQSEELTGVTPELSLGRAEATPDLQASHSAALKKAMPKNVKLQLTGKDPDAGKD